jgi:hypothetical protein
MKRLVVLKIAMFLCSSLMAFPWSTPLCERSGKWCHDSNSGQSAFSGWVQMSSSGFGSPYHKHISVPVEHILERPHVLAGVLGLSRKIDNVLDMILKASNRESALDQLQSDYGLSLIQAEGILDMPLQHLTENGIKVLSDEYRGYVD